MSTVRTAVGDSLLILNYNDLFASALAVRLRAEQIDCTILPGDTPYEQVIRSGARGLVLAGSTLGVEPAQMDIRLLQSGLPVLAMGDAALGVALLLGAKLGEKQAAGEVREVHFDPSALTGDMQESDRYLSVIRPMHLPQTLALLAHSDGQALGFMHKDLPIYAFAFQIESNDPDGTALLMRFAQDVCGATPWLTDSAFIAWAKDSIAQAAGEEGYAACVMTGGLDGGVAATLGQRVLGDRLQCIFIDTGLLREREAEDFLRYYREEKGMNILHISAGERFEAALRGVLAPADKAAVISRVYGEVLEETARDMRFDLVIRGTSANDILQTGDGYITPGLRAGTPVVEPLRELFKEEIRRIGEALGMPGEVCQAQPFPGTGLALRIMGEVTRTRLAILRKSDAMFREEVRQAGLGKRLWKFFAVLYPLDYDSQDAAVAVALRAVTIGNKAGIVKALPARLPHDLQERCAARVMQAFPEVLRVVNDITPGSRYSEIEWS